MGTAPDRIRCPASCTPGWGHQHRVADHRPILATGRPTPTSRIDRFGRRGACSGDRATARRRPSRRSASATDAPDPARADVRAIRSSVNISSHTASLLPPGSREAGRLALTPNRGDGGDVRGTRLWCRTARRESAGMAARSRGTRGRRRVRQCRNGRSLPYAMNVERPVVPSAPPPTSRVRRWPIWDVKAGTDGIYWDYSRDEAQLNHCHHALIFRRK